MDAPAGGGSAEDHLERPPEAAILHPELEQRDPTARAERSDVTQAHPCPAPDRACEVRVRQAGVGRPRPRVRSAPSEHEVGASLTDRCGDEVGVGRVEGAIGVHEAHDVVSGGEQPGEARRTEAPLRLVHDGGTVSGGDLGRAVHGAVVDDDRSPLDGHPTEHPRKRSGLVEHRQDQVHPGRTVVVATLSGWVALVAGVRLWGLWLAGHGRDLTLGAVPLFGHWDVRLGVRIVPAVVVAALVVAVAPRVVAALPWRRLVAVAAVVTVAWATSLALIDSDGLVHGVQSRHEYLPFARHIGDLPGFLRTFTDRLPEYPTHVKGHPPGMVVLLRLLDHFGLAGRGWVAALVIVGGGVAVAATLVLLRAVAGEAAARHAAPFLPVAPLAIWIASSADALFAGVALTGAAVVAVAARRDSAYLAFGAGMVLGIACHLSYGLVLVAPLALVALRPRPRLVVPIVSGALAVTALFVAAGFRWWDGLFATQRAYADGAAANRPWWFFVVANVAVVAIAVGPVVVVGLARLRGSAWLVVGSVAVAIGLADLSLLSKAEVERIWLFLTIPLVVAAAAHAGPRLRWWLGAHVLGGLLLAVTLDAGW